MTGDMAPVHAVQLHQLHQLHQLRQRQAQLEMENEQLRAHLLAHLQQAQLDAAALACAQENASQASARAHTEARHELRQPLAALGIYVSVLKNHVAPAGLPLLASLKECLASLDELLAKR